MATSVMILSNGNDISSQSQQSKRNINRNNNTTKNHTNIGHDNDQNNTKCAK